VTTKGMTTKDVTTSRATTLRQRLARPRDPLLGRDGSGRFLPWMIALMVYLAAIALAGMVALDGAVSRWDSALVGTLTVQLPAAAAGDLDKVLALLRATPGVRSAAPLDDAANAALLKPWLGNAVALDELSLPRLVDVRIDPAVALDRAALAARLRAAAAGARLDDNRRWLDHVLGTVLAIEILAGAIVALIALATVISIVFATRTSLAIHQGTVEVLHLIGAHDSYIAGQFQWQALRLGLRGGVIGLVPAVLTLLALGAMTGGAGFGPSFGPGVGSGVGPAVGALPRLALGPFGWILLLLLPPAAGLTALATARITVLRGLARML
jgi:cell division transport system permease protein